MVNSLFDITGKKAIVTGGTRGLGKGMAEGLMESGAEVAIIGTSDKVYQVADEFKARGFVCYGVKADLSDRDQCNEAFNKCVELLGDLDILVPAHGIQRRHPSNEFPDKDWDDVINTNLNSVFWLSRAASNIFKAKGYGKIIMIASMCSWFGGKTVPAYSAAKGGVMQLCKAFSNDLLQYGINVNCVAPGGMVTPGAIFNNAATAALYGAEWTHYVTEYGSSVPVASNPDEIARMILTMCTPMSDFMYGQLIEVDGGSQYSFQDKPWSYTMEGGVHG